MQATWKLTGTLAVLLIASAALAQHDPTDPQVNISGATLFEDFFTARGSTNDYIDVDGDTYKQNLGSPYYADSLAKSWSDFTTLPTPWSTYDGHMYVTYRGVGSGSGLKEMLNHQAVLNASSTAQGWYGPSRTGASSHVPYANVPTAPPSDVGFTNRQEFASDGNITGPGTYTSNGSGVPIAQSGVDIGVMDVPTSWFVTQSGTGSWGANPASTGYGNNEMTSFDTGQSNKLKSLTVTLNDNDTNPTATEDVTFNLNTASPDSKTVYSTPVAFVPIGIITNRGTGMKEAKFSEMQTLFTTGRMPTGENLKAATRDSGSGTRNGSMNSLGIDPSWGRGENMGSKTGSDEPCYLGDDHQVSNLGGSSYMQYAVGNDRLAVGYQGVQKAESKKGKGHVEHVKLWKDVGPVAEKNDNYYMPSVTNIVDNAGADGWKMGSNETMATVGNPEETDGTSSTYMANQAAAAYIRNIKQSVAGFASDPTGSSEYFMPGELLATTFFLTGALEMSPGDTSGLDWVDQRSGSGDGSQNTTLATYIKNNNTLSPHAWGDSNWVPQVPKRTNGTYDDGDNGTNGYYYYTDATGNTDYLPEGSAQATLDIGGRNQTQGDFNNDGQRNIDDLAKLMEAYNYTPNATDGTENLTNSVLAWAYKENDGVMPHLIGDFDGDGNFNAEDIRYFCDGLAIQTDTGDAEYGRLDKAAAYAAADAAGIFTTTKANGGSLQNGETMYDVAGSDTTAELLGATPGAAPNGHDGTIDGYDISYAQRILNGKLAEMSGVSAPAQLRWSVAEEALFMDLSVDFDGDLDIDGDDIAMLIGDTLQTRVGDANLDGTVDLLDLGSVGDNWKQAGTYWGEGDFNGDGVVNLLDLGTIGDNWKQSGPIAGGGTVPEPTTMGLLALGGLAVLRRRSRKAC